MTRKRRQATVRKDPKLKSETISPNSGFFATYFVECRTSLWTTLCATRPCKVLERRHFSFTSMVRIVAATFIAVVSCSGFFRVALIIGVIFGVACIGGETSVVEHIRRLEKMCAKAGAETTKGGELKKAAQLRYGASIVAPHVAAVARAWAQRARTSPDAILGRTCIERPVVEVQLERKTIDESWGFAWKVGPKARGQLVVAGVSSKSPAARWNEQARKHGGLCLRRGCELFCVNGASDIEEMTLFLANRCNLTLRFHVVHLPESQHVDEIRLPGEIADVSKKLTNVVSKTASAPWRVKNSFLEIISSDNALDEKEVNSAPLSEPPPSRLPVCEFRQLRVRGCRARQKSTNGNCCSDNVAKTSAGRDDRESQLASLKTGNDKPCYDFVDTSSGFETDPSILPGICASVENAEPTQVHPSASLQNPTVFVLEKLSGCTWNGDEYVQSSVAGQEDLICGLTLQSDCNDFQSNFLRYESALRGSPEAVDVGSCVSITPTSLLAPITTITNNINGDSNSPAISGHGCFEIGSQACQATWWENWCQQPELHQDFCGQFGAAAEWPLPLSYSVGRPPDWQSCSSIEASTFSNTCVYAPEAVTTTMVATKPRWEGCSYLQSPVISEQMCIPSVGTQSVHFAGAPKSIPVSTSPSQSGVDRGACPKSVPCKASGSAATITVVTAARVSGVVATTGPTLNEACPMATNSLSNPAAIRAIPPPKSPPRSLTTPCAVAFLSLDDLVESSPLAIGNGPLQENDRSIVICVPFDEGTTSRCPNNTGVESCKYDEDSPHADNVAENKGNADNRFAGNGADISWKSRRPRANRRRKQPKRCFTDEKPENEAPNVQSQAANVRDANTTDGHEHVACSLEPQFQEVTPDPEPYSGLGYFSLDGSLSWSLEYEDPGSHEQLTLEKTLVADAQYNPNRERNEADDSATGERAVETRQEPYLEQCSVTPRSMSGNEREETDVRKGVSASDLLVHKLCGSSRKLKSRQRHRGRSKKTETQELHPEADSFESWSWQGRDASAKSSSSKLQQSPGASAKNRGRPKKVNSDVANRAGDVDDAKPAWYAESPPLKGIGSKASVWKSSKTSRCEWQSPSSPSSDDASVPAWYAEVQLSKGNECKVGRRAKGTKSSARSSRTGQLETGWNMTACEGSNSPRQKPNGSALVPNTAHKIVRNGKRKKTRGSQREGVRNQTNSRWEEDSHVCAAATPQQTPKSVHVSVQSSWRPSLRG